MRHFTTSLIEKLVLNQPQLKPTRAPQPFPGRKWPTRVAWKFVFASRPSIVKKHNPWPQLPTYKKQSYERITLSYIGKPNRYRALELDREVQRYKDRTICGWEAEFDAGGLIAWRIYAPGGYMSSTGGAYFAYHPQAESALPVHNFTTRNYVKRIGKLSTYSLQKTLTQERIDTFYLWYEKQFGRKLKRPKSTPLTIIGGPNEEASSKEPGEVTPF